MVYQPPTGARDLLPLDVAQKRWIEDRLEQVFQRWGYHRIITPTIERLDTLMAGGAIDQEAVIELHQAAGPRLGLRPELTASIARAAVSRLSRVTYPQRLYYNANVFRQADQGHRGSQQEFFQAGVELLGAGDPLADAEMLLLLTDGLASLNLRGWSLLLGDAQLTRALLEPFPAAVRRAVRQSLAHLDRVTLETLDLSPQQREQALYLLDLRGEPEDILQALGTLDLGPEGQASLQRLKSLVALLREVPSSQGEALDRPALILDLSLIQTFDYYTGLVFEVVSPPELGCQVLGRGGRYDHLLEVFSPEGAGFPGIGFVFDIDMLHQALLPSGRLPQSTPPSDWLVVPTVPQAAVAAFTYAQTLRGSANLVRAEVHLAEVPSQDALRAVARHRHIQHIAWIDANGLPQIETLH
ncbi:ATP phosphoribosyltransferase regulatory subunit [Leptolyngbya sp. BL0902]|uniref:ATP phosphoribosyltransferase regulatory subunit n=1 Tax=Leptolyngbya sp. BL0902 TaxID=1115757 RepID=UPI0018E75872|nr:ATP phosphoribosyltransferase regulatory subunit [Leptolyngbya sp. BL0902]QQE65490.1 ATP phosphoribosyltransferase regulatory subunit [Leptolyngbya sp. BL0902]